MSEEHRAGRLKRFSEFVHSFGAPAFLEEELLRLAASSPSSTTLSSAAPSSAEREDGTAPAAAVEPRAAGRTVGAARPTLDACSAFPLSLLLRTGLRPKSCGLTPG